MREIKFKGKMHEGEWIYSDNNGLYDFFYGIDDGQIDGETVGEFINETDMSNNELYTGNIVKFDVREVFGESPELDQIGIISCKKLGEIHLGDWLLQYCINIKRIGNIYDNLSEVKDE